MTLKYEVGDLIEAAKCGEVNVIAHGCNCYNTMGNGIAPLIKKAFPEAFNADQQTVKGSQDKLGKYSKAVNYTYELPVVVYNLYTQFGFWGRNKGLRDLDYNAMYTALEAMSEDLCSWNSIPQVGLPLIGCGLAGGNWNIVETMIKETLIKDGHNVTIYKLK